MDDKGLFENSVQGDLVLHLIQHFVQNEPFFLDYVQDQVRDEDAFGLFSNSL